MKYNELRNEIKSYYSTASYENAKKYLEVGTKKLDELYDKSMSAYDMKVLQYKTITDILKMHRSIMKRELFRDFPTVQEIITGTNISVVGLIEKTFINLLNKILNFGSLAVVRETSCFT